MTTPAPIRNRYDNATARLSVFLIMCDKASIGRIVITGKPTASGHMYRCFFHLFGSPMVEGTAKGGGYDMATASLSDALRKAWPSMRVHERARFEQVLLKLESSSLDNALSAIGGDWFAVRAV